MATTVQISQRTKEELLIIKAKLEQNTGQKKTLEEAILWLLERESSPTPYNRVTSSDKIFGSIQDLDIALHDVTQLRKERSSRFEDI